jgi:hypothetical protein
MYIQGFAENILYCLQFMKDSTQSDHKIQTLSIMQQVCRELISDIQSERMNQSSQTISKQDIIHHISKLLSNIYQPQHRSLLLEPLLKLLKKQIVLKQMFIQLVSAKSRRSIHNLVTYYWDTCKRYDEWNPLQNRYHSRSNRSKIENNKKKRSDPQLRKQQ